MSYRKLILAVTLFALGAPLIRELAVQAAPVQAAPVQAASVQAAASQVMASQATATLPAVILVRHAEKAATPADDPSLSPEGAERARALEQALAGAGVTAVITTEFKRTRETAAPLAQKRGIAAEVISARAGSVDAHAQAIAAAVRKHTGGVVLVVGHSNTVPAIIAALGGERMRDICDADYANLFILSQASTGVSVIRSRFGAADKSETAPGTCTPMR
jgi:phosphohistidine phosphatase SixA